MKHVTCKGNKRSYYLFLLDLRYRLFVHLKVSNVKRSIYNIFLHSRQLCGVAINQIADQL